MCCISTYIRLSPSFSEETHPHHVAPTLTTIFCFVTDLSQHRRGARSSGSNEFQTLKEDPPAHS